MGKVERVLRAAYFALLGVPVAFAPTGVRARVVRRVFRSPFELREPGVWRAIAHSVLALAVGLVAWFAAFLMVIAAVRGIFYPLIAAHDYEHSWGGPTLAGAWAVHFAGGALPFPLWVLLIAGLGWIQLQLTRRLLGRVGPWWPVPISVLLFLGGTAFFIAWLHQV
ncbi:sensor domain-containing protein [Nocardia sp. CDC153]|uniref:sensor domain-containing protein n=1 Tax=Nocardia sp. CDC153 TaxID=3112167 RepID=UPI002DBE419C|nr:sensor domain-containing protein [Nocardia sp. CDC153]MEC3956477.1 sensor domain-containing protein [Nocardia sp. CDC153]